MVLRPRPVNTTYSCACAYLCVCVCTHAAVLHLLLPLHFVTFVVLHQRLHQVLGPRASGVFAASVGQSALRWRGRDRRHRSHLLDFTCRSERIYWIGSILGHILKNWVTDAEGISQWLQVVLQLKKQPTGPKKHFPI